MDDFERRLLARRRPIAALALGTTGVFPLLGVLACTGPTREYFEPNEGIAGALGTGGASATTSAGASNGGAIATTPGAAGSISSAGATALGGSTSAGAGGTAAPLGGSAGAVNAGGTFGATGGSATSASGGGATSEGGAIGAGGSSGASGAISVGGATSSGGTLGTSGAVSTGGMLGTAGAQSFGGTLGTGGGTFDAGGTISTGGTIAAGGTPIGGAGGGAVGGSTGKPLGQPCSAGSDCGSSNCLDGVCCQASACPQCMNCGTSGLCTVAVVGQPDVTGDTCRTDPTGVRTCDSQGRCSSPHPLKRDLNPTPYTINGVTNTYPSYPRSFTQGPDRRVYFSATDGTSGDELWVTDGTNAGTFLVADLLANAGNSSPRGLVNAGSNLYFSAFDASGYPKLFATNGTAAGTRLVKDLGNAAFAGNALAARALGNAIYFTGCGAAGGCELWRSDGTDAGTVMVADIMTTASGSTTQNFGSYPSELTVMGGAVYFRAANQVVGLGSTNTIADYELWRSDGLATNTVRVADIEPGIANSTPTNLAVLSSAYGLRLLFAASRGATNQELYVSDGSVGNVTSIDINPGAIGSYPGPFVMMGNRAYFGATDATTGRELWTTDGTQAGTFLVKDINLGVSNSSPSLLTVAGNFLYFQASDGTAGGSQLWRSDGTSNGTTKVFGNFTPAGATLFEMAGLGNQLFLSTAGGSGELWVTDGTTAGTYRSCPDRSQPYCDPFTANPSGFAAIGGRMYFNATAMPYAGGSWGAEPFVYP